MSENKDLDVVIDAGKLLMESGAEIFRVEETMRHMARVMEISEFDAYTVTGGIMSSGKNRVGERVSRVANVPVIKTHLGKLEAVNELSRSLERQEKADADEISRKLDNIRKLPDCSLLITLIAYFFGAGGFAYATGSTVIDSLASSVTGLVLGIITYFVEKVIRTKFLVTIIGSIAVTLVANLFCMLGFGQMRGLIILGAFMLMVPGAIFVNSVREFSENNYATGISHFMSALLTSISMAVGVAAVSQFFPFADQMSESFALSSGNIIEDVFRVILAGIGTLAFAVLYNAPKRYYLDIGLLGAASWAVYLTVMRLLGNDVIGVLAAALLVSVSSRILSVVRGCPMTIFLSTSIFPLVPGITLYRGIFFLLTGQYSGGYACMKSGFMFAFMIAIAIGLSKQFRFRSLFAQKKSAGKKGRN